MIRPSELREEAPLVSSFARVFIASQKGRRPCFDLLAVTALKGPSVAVLSFRTKVEEEVEADQQMRL